MNPEQIQRLNCDIDFALSGLQNTCLDNFYLPDLPSDWFCVVHDENKIKPSALKALLENIHSSVMQQGPESNFNAEKNVIPAEPISIVVVFTSDQYALENCRNAILLKTMM